MAASPNLSDDLATAAENIAEPGKLADFVASIVPTLSPAERQALLEQFDPRARLTDVHRHLTRELELLELRGRIQSQVQGQLSQSQREFYLREQLKAIQKELGEGDDTQRDVDELRQETGGRGNERRGQSRGPQASSTVWAACRRMSPEYGVARTYLEWMAALPWSHSSGSQVDVKRAARDPRRGPLRSRKGEGPHPRLPGRAATAARAQGPDPVLRRAARSGQDSLGSSIARALGRKFARISMGGMHDEAEIRGHRRTYIGALPGQIIQGVRRAGANDPGLHARRGG